MFEPATITAQCFASTLMLKAAKKVNTQIKRMTENLRLSVFDDDQCLRSVFLLDINVCVNPFRITRNFI